MSPVGYLTLCIDDTVNLKLWAAVADYATLYSVKTCFAPHTRCISAPELKLRKQDFSLMCEFTKFHEICSHTASHLFGLAELPEEIIYSELKESKITLEDGLCTEINTIVYPRGSFNEKVIGLAEEVGYEAGRAVVVIDYDGSIEKTNPMYIGSLNAARHLGHGSGAYDLENRLEILLKTRNFVVLVGHTNANFSLDGWKRVIDYASKNDVPTLTIKDIADLVRSERSKCNNLV